MKDTALGLGLIACFLSAAWLENHDVEISLPPAIMHLIDPTLP